MSHSECGSRLTRTHGTLGSGTADGETRERVAASSAAGFGHEPLQTLDELNGAAHLTPCRNRPRLRR